MVKKKKKTVVKLHFLINIIAKHSAGPSNIVEYNCKTIIIKMTGGTLEMRSN